MYEDDHVQIRDRLLRRTSDSLPTARERALSAYLFISALLSCDLYPQEGIETRDTGHYRWAVDIMAGALLLGVLISMAAGYTS